MFWAEGWEGIELGIKLALAFNHAILIQPSPFDQVGKMILALFPELCQLHFHTSLLRK